MNAFLNALVVYTVALPDVTPEQPPGTEGFITALNWVSWIMIIGALAAFIISAGMLAFSALTGREINSFKGLVLAIVAAILVGAAGGIMQIFI